MLVGEAVEEARRLTGGGRGTRNRLTTAVLTTDDTFTFDFDLRGIQHGARLDVDAETVFVWQSDGGTKTATVERGEDYTEVQAHDAGTTVLVAPRFTGAEIRKAVQRDVSTLAAEGLFRMERIQVPFDYVNYAFDLSAVGSYISLWRLEVLSGGLTRFVNGFHRDGDLLRPHHGVMPDSGVGWVHVRRGFAPFVGDGDDLETVCGVPASAHDLVPLGAAYRLLAGEEGRRVDLGVQPPRRPEDVPPGSAARAAGQLQMQRAIRLSEEVLKLRKRYPIRMRG